MLRRISSIISALLVSAVMFTAAAPAVSAAAATKEEYQAVNTNQKDFYTSTYVPSYNSYRQTLIDLKAQIKNTNFETLEQAQRVIDFLKDLQKRHSDFFGTRDTIGKSRYDVPAAREAMYKAADEDHKYDLAIQYCNQLKTLVEARVNFMNQIENEIKNFVLIPSTPAASDATVVFNADQIWSSYSFGFKILVKNTTNQDISNWTLTFELSGASVNTVWVNGGSMKLKNNGNTVTISPLNKWQNGYTIPANGTLVIEGTANGNGNTSSVSDCSFNGNAVSISYAK